MGIKDIPQGIQVNQRKRIGAIETPRKPVSTGKGTQVLPSSKTSAIDPKILEAAKRLQAYAPPNVDPDLARVREALDKVRAQFPELSDQQWSDYLSRAPQLEVEKKAVIAADSVVKSATPEQQANAVKTSAKTQGTYTAEEILIYKDLKKKLPLEGQANLKKLLMDGQLLKQDAKNSGNLLHYLNGLSAVNFKEMKLEEENKNKSVIEQVLHDIAHPEDIKQRMDVSCLGAAGQYDMATNRPAEYARVVSELYSTTDLIAPSEGTAGGADLASLFLGNTVKDLKKDLPFLNLTMLGKSFEKGIQDGSYSTGYLQSLVNYVDKSFPKMGQAAKDFIGRLKEAGQAFVEGNFIEAMGLIKKNKELDVDHKASDEFQYMAGSLVTDVGVAFQLNVGKGGDQMGSYAKTGLFGLQGYYVDDKGKALDSVKAVLGSGEDSVYAVLKGEEVGHMVVLKEVRDGKIAFFDPESGNNDLQTLDASKFSEQCLSVFLPNGRVNGLSHIREDDTTPIWGRGSRGGTKR